MVNNKNKEKQFSRRDFMKTTGAFTGGIVGGSLFGGVVGHLYKDDSSDNEVSDSNNVDQNNENTDTMNNYGDARMFFDRYEDYQTLEAASELIYPKDDLGPGAIELGVPIFIDKQLAMIWGINGDDYRQGPFPKNNEFSGLDKVIHSKNNRQSIFLDGLRTLQSESQERYDMKFYEISESEQSNIMDDFMEGKVEMKTVDSDGFFSLLKQSVMEGAYSDPLYGGNIDMAGWKMRNYPGPQMSYGNWIDSEEFVQDQIEPVSLIDYQQG